MICVIYARYSSENQSEESITAQVRACTEYAVRNGHTVVEHYIDRAMSARSDQRPQFQRMIEDSKKHTFQAVIVHKLDRFSRDRFDHAIYRRELTKNGVCLLSVLENLDDSPESVVLESVLEGFSEYYSKNLARETRKGLKEIALQAKRTSGSILYGYNVDASGNYIINEQEAAVVRSVFDCCISGIGYNKILDRLRREGIKTKRGKPFTANSFHYMLRNRRYCGDYIYSPIGELKYHRCDPIIIENAIPAIVPKSTWLQVQEIMDKRKNHSAGKVKQIYLLSGILYCGRCGAPMAGHRQKRREDYVYYSYECTTKQKTKGCTQHCVRCDRIETAVCNFVKTLMQPASVQTIKDYLLAHIDLINKSTKSEVTAYKNELKKLDSKINTALDLLLEMPGDSLKQKLSELENRKLFVESKITELEHTYVSESNIESMIVTCLNFDELKREEKREIIRKIVKKITIVPDGDLRCAIYTTYSALHFEIGGATQNTIPTCILNL